MEFNWKYFFGGSSGRSFDRYYYDVVNGVRVEKHANQKRTSYSIGNIDKCKKRFVSEDELRDALNQQSEIVK